MEVELRSGSSTAAVSATVAGTVPAFANRYGYFDGTDFVIRDVKTPRPWVNVLSNGRYGLILSQAGGGFSWLDNCQLFRLTRWEQDLATDAYGRFVYLSDLSSGEVWSTTYAPTHVEADFEEVRHGLGHTVFTREVHGVRTVHTVFVPEGTTHEVWMLEIENLSETTRCLRTGASLDWHIGSHGEWHREFHRLFVTTKIVENGTVAWKRARLEENTREPAPQQPAVYFGCFGAGPVRWTTDKASWYGPSADPASPLSMREDAVPASTGRWDDPVAAFTADVRLAPGERRQIVMVLGTESDPGKAETALQTFEPGRASASFAETLAFHDSVCGALQIECDDPVVELMANAWLPFQTLVGRIRARCAYYQQGGAYGFRDQLQDSLAFLDQEPKRAVDQILLHAEAMYADGGVRHWWHPGSPIFAESRHSDTCLWLAHATLDALDEAGEPSLLDLEAGFLDRTTQAVGSKGTVLEHCLRGIDRSLELRSPRGLPLILAGDWNDGLSHAGLDGKGESVWLAMFLYQILGRMATALDRRGESTTAVRYRQEAEDLRTAVEGHAWEGDRYIAGTNDEGRPFGSKENREGSLFLNPQTWSVISGIAAPDRARKAMETALAELVKPYGALLLAPAYQDVDPYIGYITRYAPGLRENGGVYSHASTWAVQALAMAGRADEAYALWRGMCPPLRAHEDADLYAAEPYVMPGNTDGPDSPHTSRAGWTWYTGSAAWMRRVLAHWVFGVRPTYDGLVVDPDLPSTLQGFRMHRPFRGGTVVVEVQRGDKPGAMLDGGPWEGTPIEVRTSGQARSLRVVTRR
ncbi:MAG: glycosyl transferase family 36 [Armatimonadetes bacterium]|nr:glycosyl transferase family 36 [Armatimonadota bacterium]